MGNVKRIGKGKPSVNAVLDASGAIQSLGETSSFVAPAGGRVLATTVTLDDYFAAEASATGPHDLVLDTSGAIHKIVVRSRAASAAESDAADRADILAKLDAAIANWATLTPAQKDTLLLVCVRGVRKNIRNS